MPDPQKTDPSAVPPPATPPSTDAKPSLIGLEQEGVPVEPPPRDTSWGTDETKKR